MDHIPSLPRSYKGNTELLIWVDLFTGYVIASAQTVAESYEECVFRRVASEMIRHDREPGFMSDFSRAFNKILGQRQRATMAYRPQANGTAERMVQTATRALKMCFRDLDQKDWGEYAARLTFAINTAYDRIRGDTPHFRVHGWDPRSTLEAILHQTARSRLAAVALSGQTALTAIAEESQRQIEKGHCGPGQPTPDRGRISSLVISRASERRIRPKISSPVAWAVPCRRKDQLIHPQARGGGYYQIFPVVHVSKLKLVKDFPDRSRVELTVSESDPLDFDEILLPEDSWVPDLGAEEYEVERMSDVRSRKKTRFCRVYRERLVPWVGYNEPTWVDETDLNCGAILNAFLRERANRNRSNVMQSHEKI
ncbi:reverse transcriptase [Phytophthora megakarya]|uniref:Reverse transcriptase n=1 Tax=Phytophthora megakarya TaxID=4795 RepID=A0A225VZ00_9STRA|nr:reverse transcriptase [Phytophthora megakarya]